MAHQSEHGHIVKVDSTSGGSLADYSDDVISVTPPQINNNMNQYHTGESRAPKTTVGGYTSEATLEVVRDPSASSLHAVLMAWQFENPPVPRSWQIDLPDSAAGSERYTFEGYVSYTSGVARGGSGTPSTGSARIMSSGAITYSVISS